MRKECWENLTTIKGKKERGKQLATYLTCVCEWAAERGGTGGKEEYGKRGWDGWQNRVSIKQRQNSP